MTAQIAEARSRLEQQVAELAALTEVGRLLTGTLDLSEVLRRLIELARTRLGADVAGIWLREEPSGLAHLYAEVGAGARPQDYRMRFRPGQGLVGWIMEHREPLVLADCRTDPRLFDRDSIEADGLHSFLGVPILLEDVVVGVLVCLRRERREFSQAEVVLARLFALPAAVAIRNARLFQESRTHGARVEALLDLSRQISQIQPSQSVLESIVQACGNLLGTDSVSVRLAEGEDLVLAAAVGAAREARFVVRIKVGEALAGCVAATGEPLLVRDPADDPRPIPAHRDQFRRLGIRWFLGVPIKIGERVLGVLTILTRREEGFSEGDVTAATAFASHAAIAVENARLVEELNQALEELNAMQQQLVRSQTLRAVGVLASGAAHHLNNLLAVILGNIQLLLEGVRKPEIRHALELLEQTTQDAADVVRRLQRFSRVEPFANMVPVDLNALAREVLELTQPLWQDEALARGVRIEAVLDPGEIPAVTGDPGALRETLMNLLLNAIEALPKGGGVTVKTWRSGHAVRCSVADSGVGMSDYVRERALEPFFTTKGPKSTGLGLSVAYGILQRHGGDLAIESAEGQATTVTIRLPLTPAKAERKTEPPAPPTAPLAILLIEDEATVRETLAKLLTSQRHRVVQAAGGEEGLAQLGAGEPVDLVLTDLGMPGMTGWEVARAVKARWPHLPVGLITGWGEEPEGSDEERQAVDFVISKPVTLDTLRAALAGLRPQRSQG
jgi:signal transduction histidine kinase